MMMRTTLPTRANDDWGQLGPATGAASRELAASDVCEPMRREAVFEPIDPIGT
jgi:hypothetical protein